MAITNLTGYTWVGNKTVDIISMVGIHATTTAKNFNVNVVWNSGSETFEKDILKFAYVSKYNFYVLSIDEIGLYNTVSEGWLHEYPLGATIKFTGGTDATNTELIAWLEANGTLTKPAITQLAPFLTSIANAIRKKKGTTAPINAQDFASEIESIETAAKGYTLTMNVVSGNNGYLSGVAYATNGGETYTKLSSSQVGTAITINNISSITFKDVYSGFMPDSDSGVKIGSTSGGEEYGHILLGSERTITIDLTQDTTIYVQGATLSAPPLE